MFDDLGSRMKNDYENRTRYFLPRRTYIIIRVDGKAFHSYTKGFEEPFDENLIGAMNETAKYLCKNIMGAQVAYVQSDEISILITDFKNKNTEAWFDNNMQKMCSVSASMATRRFNEYMVGLNITEYGSKWAEFDSRVFSIPNEDEVVNYFKWRMLDCSRNSISSVAQSLFSHKELHKKGCSEMIQMIRDKGKAWEDYESELKYGRLIKKEYYTSKVRNSESTVLRSRWSEIGALEASSYKTLEDLIYPINNIDEDN